MEVRLLTNLRTGGTVAPTGVSTRVRRVHLDVVVAHQSPVGIIHALDRPRKNIERGRMLIRGGWSGLQLGAPRIGKSNGTVRRSRGIRDGFTERGEREVEFCGHWLEELGVDIDHLRDRAETPGLTPVWKWKQMMRFTCPWKCGD